MKMHLSSRMVSCRGMRFGWERSVQREISRIADWEMPVYWIVSFSLSGLNLERRERKVVSDVGEELRSEGEGYDGNLVLFDSEDPLDAIDAHSFVHAPISPTADESNNLVSIQHMHFTLISRCRRFLCTGGFYVRLVSRPHADIKLFPPPLSRPTTIPNINRGISRAARLDQHLRKMIDTIYYAAGLKRGVGYLLYRKQWSRRGEEKNRIEKRETGRPYHQKQPAHSSSDPAIHHHHHRYPRHYHRNAGLFLRSMSFLGLYLFT